MEDSSLPSPGLRDQTTVLLARVDAGEAVPVDRLLPIVYDELRALARRQLLSERPDHTLQATALVHEAYLRLVDDSRVTGRGRAYFFAAAAQAMRRVLVDHARRRGALKRSVTPADDPDLADHFAVEIQDLDRALDRLAALEPRHARVVECRYFGGLSVGETAEALGVSPRTVKYDWAMARAWLHRELGEGPGERG